MGLITIDFAPYIKLGINSYERGFNRGLLQSQIKKIKIYDEHTREYVKGYKEGQDKYKELQLLYLLKKPGGK